MVGGSVSRNSRLIRARSARTVYAMKIREDGQGRKRSREIPETVISQEHSALPASREENGERGKWRRVRKHSSRVREGGGIKNCDGQEKKKKRRGNPFGTRSKNKIKRRPLKQEKA